MENGLIGLRGCLELVSMSMLVNDSPSKEFFFQRRGFIGVIC